MLEQNKKIALTDNEALDAFKEIEFIFISLRKMGNFYAEKPGALEEYQKATTDFIDNYAVTKRLTKVRTIISRHFDDSLGKDDMGDIERHFSDLKFWEPNKPLKKATTNPVIPRGKTEQVTCKHNELLVVFTNKPNESLPITFHNTIAFKGVNTIGAKLILMQKIQDARWLSITDRIPNRKMSKPLTELQQFFGAYFNQDWVEDHASADEVIDTFLLDSSRDVIFTVRKEILKLIDTYTNESALQENLLHEQYCYYYYPNQWASGLLWLNHIVGKFDNYLLKN